MSCPYCNDTSWILIKKDAPSPPYNEGYQLEYAERCVCTYGTQRPNKNHQNEQNPFHAN